MRVAVFASGNGSNLQSLIDTCHGNGKATIALVLSDRSNAGALRRAKTAKVPTTVLDDYRDGDTIVAILGEHDIDFVVLAGYLRLIPPAVVRAYDKRMINIHPALLPSFGGKGMFGMHVHMAVLESGVRVSGPTIHLVTHEYDRGQILAQWPVPVLANDTPETLAARVLEVEHKLLPAVIESIATSGPGNFQFSFIRFRGDSVKDFLNDTTD